MDVKEAQAREDERRHEDMMSRYDGTEIRDMIIESIGERDSIKSLACSQIAKAMIQYNMMIENRWRK